jgi:hypothetical protein
VDFLACVCGWTSYYDVTAQIVDQRDTRILLIVEDKLDFVSRIVLLQQRTNVIDKSLLVAARWRYYRHKGPKVGKLTTCFLLNVRGIAHAAQQRLNADPNSNGSEEVIDDHFNASKEVEA